MIKFYAALWVGKAVKLMTRIMGRIMHKGGTNLPGDIALKICPDFLKYVARPAQVICVTGTNGKTTTTNMMADVLEKSGRRVLSNRMGGNINSGIATCLMTGVSLFNKSRYPIAVLETDERSALRIYPYIQPDYVVGTNLVRDSCRRNAHPHYIFNIIDSALPEKTRMIRNADDIISCNLAKNNDRVYYAIDRLPDDRTKPFNIINDMAICPECHATLEYDFVRYNHIGRVRCPKCGLTSPKADYLATAVNAGEKTLTVSEKGVTQVYPLISESVYHVYDQLAVIAMLRELGLTPQELADAMGTINIVQSRYREDVFGGIKVISHMAKGQNAPACSTVFGSVANAPGDKEIVLAIEDLHDNIDSSENISFIYDVDFEFLAHESIKRIVVVGKRSLDMKLRMLMAGIPAKHIVICQEEEKIAECLTFTPGRDVYLLYELYQIPLYKKLWEHIRLHLTEGSEKK